MPEMYYRKTFKPFGGERLEDYLGTFTRKYSSEIANEPEAYLLSVNETDYVEHLQSRYQIGKLELHFENVTVDTYEANITRDFIQDEGVSLSEPYITRDIIQFFIPYSGDIYLLEKRPNYVGFDRRNAMFDIRDNCLVVEFINLYNNPADIRNTFDVISRHLEAYLKRLNDDISSFNSSIKSYSTHLIEKRKLTFSKKNSMLEALNIPLRKKSNVAPTFAIPKPQLRDKIVVKPVVKDAAVKPEPALDNENYYKILKIINDVGKNFERLPSVYKDKKEEDLRDHILLILDPNFEYGSATGETFNKSGKTDIQLRYDSSVVFIAECKFWNGEKTFHQTLDQLLGYLTWRDSKTSVIFFVSQKDFTAILNKIQVEAAKHPNYIRFLNKSDENWFDFHFHLNGDKNRELRLAIQLFHLP